MRLFVNIPIQVPNENEFLRTHSFVETADSSYCYLLNIEEYVAKGKIAPFEYASTQISDMLVNQRKVQFLKKILKKNYIMMQFEAEMWFLAQKCLNLPKK